MKIVTKFTEKEERKQFRKIIVYGDNHMLFTQLLPKTLPVL